MPMNHPDGEWLTTGPQPWPPITQPRRSATLILGGDYDRHNEYVLFNLLAYAASRDNSDLVLDLGSVEYMGASTVQIIRRTREQLASESRSLTLRSPSPVVKRVLAVCYAATPSPALPGG